MRSEPQVVISDGKDEGSAHDAMNNVLENLNEGYEWVVNMDIEK